MRIVIDMQGAQSTGSRNRGIGRYTLSLAQAIARNRGRHDVFLALNGLFSETIEFIRAAFDTLIPQEQIVVWQSPGPVADANPRNRWRREAGERLREAFLANLNADVVHVSSLFEGLGDDALTAIGALENTLPTAVTLYDLIPLLYRDIYLVDPGVESWYERKLCSLRRAQLWLAISESSRRDGIARLNLPEEWVVNVSTASDPMFHPIEFGSEQADRIRRRYNLTRPFVMYTGGIDHRKNIEGLIKAYSKLSASVRTAYQLAIVCSATEEQINALRQLAARCGLAGDELVLTGFIPDSDMVSLYNLCTAFVFPSWHEGFGLPALEAMSCGAAVIAANTSSLPELIGRGDALFNPRDENEITAKLHLVLTDGAFREQLARHGLKQAKKFSWDNSARRALDAFEHLHARNRATQITRISVPTSRRHHLAYVSPLPPEKSGVAEYAAELLPELARHYDIDVIVNQQEVTDSWIRANCPIRSAEWFDQNAHRYDRVLYHFGNSVFHQYMFRLLERHLGTVVLHDFFLSAAAGDTEMYGSSPGAWTAALYASHGYHAIKERFTTRDIAAVAWKYPVNLAIVRQANGVIVHSEFCRTLADEWYGEGSADDWAVVPLLRAPAFCIDRAEARRLLNLRNDDFVVCSFGVLGPHALNHRLLSSWLASMLARETNCVLIFVGQNQSDAYGAELASKIRQNGERISITGSVDNPTFRRYLAAADVGVQLHAASCGETPATVLDCMNYGLPTIVNVSSNVADLPDDAVWKLPVEFGDAELVGSLEILWSDGSRRQQLGTRARENIRTHHAPRICADSYAGAIEKIYWAGLTGISALIQALARIEPSPTETQAWISLAESIAFSISPRIAPRQLFVDVSELVQRDAKSGIQRVVRSILQQLLNSPPKGFRVEPVYATTERGYLYARRFTLRFLNCPDSALADHPIEFRAGDLFLGLDLQPEVVPAQLAFYQQLRNCGVQVYFVVYDILPITLPGAFPKTIASFYQSWLKVVAECDGAVCISKAVAAEVADWLKKNGPVRQRPFRIKSFQLGADIAASCPSKGTPDAATGLLQAMADRPTFLMVGTLEPRKGHAQTLAAFERLWADGVQVGLVIVGKQGWLVENLIEKLRRSPFFGKHLHWLEGISDEYLEKVYKASSALLAASEGEGFGLPLIEAAQHKLPIIARDIPVFREAAGDHAFYFSGKAPEDLAAAIKEWLDLYASGKAPSSDNLPWITWQESAQQLIDVLFDKNSKGKGTEQ
jgi:glycosyltransferase involved in cell wall biosynthesis